MGAAVGAAAGAGAAPGAGAGGGAGAGVGGAGAGATGAPRRVATGASPAIAPRPKGTRSNFPVLTFFAVLSRVSDSYNLIRIRIQIQHFRLNNDPDPDPGF